MSCTNAKVSWAQNKRQGMLRGSRVAICSFLWSFVLGCVWLPSVFAASFSRPADTGDPGGHVLPTDAAAAAVAVMISHWRVRAVPSFFDPAPTVEGILNTTSYRSQQHVAAT